MAEVRYWLFKSKVSIDTFDRLLAAENKTISWVGVRNARARNYIRDEIKVGDGVLFYHSSPKRPNPPEVVGTAWVVRGYYPDYTAFEKGSRFYDCKSDPANPKWLMVDIQANLEFARPVTLREIKASDHPALRGMMLVQPGNRLSIQPVSKEAWAVIVGLGMGE